MDVTKQIALERVQTLFRLAKNVIHKDPQLAQRYVEIARKTAMRARMRIPKEYKRMICKHCKRFILPGVNCRVRIQPRRNSHVVVTCLSCMHYMRIPLKKREE